MHAKYCTLFIKLTSNKTDNTTKTHVQYVSARGYTTVFFCSRGVGQISTSATLFVVLVTSRRHVACSYRPRCGP